MTIQAPSRNALKSVKPIYRWLEIIRPSELEVPFPRKLADGTKTIRCLLLERTYARGSNAFCGINCGYEGVEKLMRIGQCDYHGSRFEGRVQNGIEAGYLL